MLGAIVGDIAGSVYEFNSIKTKDFPMLGSNCRFTDDSVMTLAVYEALKDKATISKSDEEIKASITTSMRKFGRKYPDAGYGGRFRQWLKSDDMPAYNSYGNGSAMRVSSVGWLFGSSDEVLRFATLSAEVTHNHPEGIKGAQATALAVYMARTGSSKEEIMQSIEEKFGYDLSRTLDSIRPDYSFDVSCQGSVPEGIIAFLESVSYEDCLRNAISIGGDSDTIAAIAGAMAEAFYNGIPDDILNRAKQFLTPDFDGIISL